MKKKRITAIAMAAALCLSVICQTDVRAAAAASDAEGTTYYVSTIHGKDRNDGKSEDEPFYSLQKINDLQLKPGDKVLLECGSVFTDGYLHLYGQSGSPENPILIDQYGKGADPVIQTNGQGVWFQNYGKQLDSATHVFRGYVSSAILLYDTEYIEIRNLEITNGKPEIETEYNAADVMNRTGVAAVAQDKGTIEHIYLDGLNVHDVVGNVYDKHMNNGGIYFTVFQPHNETETGVSRYDDVRIENCSVIRTNRWGIAVGYTAYHHKFTGKEISDSSIREFGATNVVVRNNYVKDSGGDAITMMYCDRPLVEYNVSDGAAQQINTTDYVNQGNRGGRVAAGVWPWKCKDAVFQYNEVFDTKNGVNGNGDAQAWDADSGDGTLYQYNYSHGNTGGCVMFCYPQAYRNTFRYNISQGDLMGMLDVSSNPDAHVYNNVFYIEEGVDFLRADHANGNANVENNIIYYAGASPKTETWVRNADKQKYSNNLYYNYANTPESDTAAVAAPLGTEIFKNAGSAPVSTDGAVNRHSSPGIKSVFDGYRLTKDSPARGAGKQITDESGKAVEKDFFGNDLTDTEIFDIGAHQFKEDEGDLILPAPEKVEASEITEDSAVIRWRGISSLLGVIGYKIMNGGAVLLDVTDLQAAADEEPGMLKVQLKNLEPGKTYGLSIAAYDENGIRSGSQEFTFTTKEKTVVEEPPKEEEPKPDVKPDIKPSPSLKLDKTSAVIYTKGSRKVTLKAEALHISGAITWTSSKPSVASVANGTVTAKKAGKTVITAQIGGYKASCSITVKKPSLKVRASVTVKKGKKVKLKVKATPSGKVTYRSSSKKTASVNAKGIIKGLKKGRCKITVKCNGVKKTVKVKVK